MSSVNEVISDELVAHAIGLDRYGNGVVHRMISLLNSADADLLAALAIALAPVGPLNFRLDDLEARLISVRRVNAAAYQAVLEALHAEIQRLVAYEGEFQAALFNHAIPAEVLARLPLTQVHADQIYSGAINQPIQGATLRDWMLGAERNRMKAMTTAISAGHVHGKTADEVIGEIRGGTVKQTDGKLEGSRRGLGSIVRTFLHHAAASVREAFYQANEGLIIAEQWVAVLDRRTTAMCRARDGKRYTPGDHRPIGHYFPWGRGPGLFHWGCRSHSAPVIKRFSMLGLSLGVVGPGARASMDGEVPADTSYLEWLSRQSAARQDEILGPTRGRLYRQGKMPLEKMYSSQGEYLTLDQLRARDAAAFRRAGL